MFESITKKRKNPIFNYIGWTLLAVCCLVFVFMFDVNQGVLSNNGAAAEVNGEAISVRSFVDLVDRMESQGNSAADAAAQKRIRQNAINMLVSQRLVSQKSNELNIYVSDDELANFLMDIEGFKEDGRFSRIRYKTYLNQSRQSVEEFEGMLRRMLLERKMLALIGHVAKDIPLISDIEKQLDQAQINISYLAFNKFNSSTTSNPGKPEVDEFMAGNLEKMQKSYENNKSQYMQKERVKARHILIKMDEKDEKSKTAAAEKIKQIKSEATPGNFSELAKKHSEDPGSKTRGGDLGFFERGRMVPPFEKVAFASEVGKISEPVETKFGYHIILVDEKQVERQKPFDEIKQAMATEMLRDEKFEKLALDMEAAVKSKDMAKVEELAKQNKLKWKDTGLFSITEEFIPGVGRVKEFMDGAMTLTAAEPISRTLVHYKTNRYIMKLKDAKLDAAAKAKKPGQMDFFKQLMEQQRANMVMQSWIDSLKKNAKISINPNIVQ